MGNHNLVEKVKQALLAMQRYSWEQGTAAQAFLEMGDAELVIQCAIDAVNRRIPDGRLAMMGGGAMGDQIKSDDPAVNGEPVLFAAQHTGNPMFQEAADEMLKYLLYRANKTDDGTLCQDVDSKIVHSDGMYLSIPYLAVAGETREAIKQIDGFRKCLWDEEKGLYSHAWDDDVKTFLRKDFWGGGNGWAAAGILRVIKAIPKGYDPEEKRRIIGHLRDLVQGCLEYLRPDGLFHDVVDNQNTFVETNLSQMLGYTIFQAVENEWMEPRFLEYARRMRKAVHAKVDEYGFVRDVCAAPLFDRPGISAEGQAFFLLMESAAKRSGESESPLS